MSGAQDGNVFTKRHRVARLEAVVCRKEGEKGPRHSQRSKELQRNKDKGRLQHKTLRPRPSTDPDGERQDRKE